MHRASPRLQNASYARPTPRRGRVREQSISDTAAVTAGSTAVCDQQTAEGAGCRALGKCSVWGARLTCRLVPARKLLDDTAQFAQTCRDSASGLADARGPRSPGSHRVVGPHRTSSGTPAGFPPVSRCPPALPLRPPSPVSLRPGFSGRSLRPLPGSGASQFPSGFVSPSDLDVGAPPAGSAGAGPGRQGPRSPVLPRPPRLDHAIRPHCRWAAAGHDEMPPRNRPLPAAASAGHHRPGTAQGGSRT